MSSYGRSKRVKREKWANRMAVLGVTMVVLCLAVAVNAKGSTLKKSDLDYQQKEKQLEEQVREEEERTKKLEEYKVYVKTKQFAEEVAKEKLGLVNPDATNRKQSPVSRNPADGRCSPLPHIR